MFAHAVVDLATFRTGGRHGRSTRQLRPGVSGEIGGTGDQSGKSTGNRVESLLDRNARGDLLTLVEPGQGLGPSGSTRRPCRVPIGPRRRRGQALLPRFALRTTASAESTTFVHECFRSPERLVGNTHHGFRTRHVFGRERVAVCLVLVGPVGRRRTDTSAQDEQLRTIVIGVASVDERSLESLDVFTDLTELTDRPAVRREAGDDVVGACERRATVDRDLVVVEHHDQTTQALVAGERGRLVAHAFHQATVACDHPGVVVAQFGSESSPQVAFGQCESDRIGQTLAEWAGGDFDTGRMAALGVTRCGRSPLPECLQVAHLHAVSVQVQQRVLEDRCVTRRQNESVAIGPRRIARIVLHDAAVEDMAEWSQRHGGALMAALGGQRSVHRQTADDVDGLAIEFGGHESRL